MNVTNLRNGTIYLYEDHPYKVLKYEHVKTARGGATIKVKSQDLITGVIKEVAFNNGDKVEVADMQTKAMQYLYSDDSSLYLMDQEDFEQYELNLDSARDELKYLVEGYTYQVILFEGKPMSIVLPASFFYKVAEAPDAVKGNTASNATKKITLENGLIIEAPQFIKKGDVVKVNTTTGEYTGRGTSEK